MLQDNLHHRFKNIPDVHLSLNFCLCVCQHWLSSQHSVVLGHNDEKCHYSRTKKWSTDMTLLHGTGRRKQLRRRQMPLSRLWIA